MKESEKGSVTMIVAVTIFFIVILLSSFFIYTTSRRRAQLEETEKIAEAYDGDMEAIYEEINNKNQEIELKVGDYVEYIPDQSTTYNISPSNSGYSDNQSISQEELKWRIMSINTDGTIDLVSDEPTSNIVQLGGALGYNNGIWILNDICKNLYSNNNLGIRARSINMEDLENKMNDKAIDEKNKYDSDGIKYKQTINYTNDYTYYPNLYKEEKGSGINTDIPRQDGISISDSFLSEPTQETFSNANLSGLTVTQTAYYFQDSYEFFDDSDFSNMIFGNRLFWVASRYTQCTSSHAGFGIRLVNKSSLGGYIIFNSMKEDYCYGIGVRPVVTLKSDIRLGDGNGTSSNPYKILN